MRSRSSRAINYVQGKHIRMKGSGDTQTGSCSHTGQNKRWAQGATSQEIANKTREQK